MNNLPVKLERLQGPEGALHQIKELLGKARPALKKEAKHYHQGFQFDVRAPSLKVHTQQQYKEVMDRSLDPVGSRILGLGGTLEVSLGLVC